MRAAMALAMLGLGVTGSAALAQAEPPRRAPPRIIITPERSATPYPLPGPAYPGPGYVRDCVAYYVEEQRPSGTVIVPRTNCGWVRGRS